MHINSEEFRYQLWLEKKQQEWESLCSCCGACCGAIEGDPCENLIKLDNGRYLCTIYSDRQGSQKTRSGKEFRCIPIQKLLHTSWPGDGQCGYKKR